MLAAVEPCVVDDIRPGSAERILAAEVMNGSVQPPALDLGGKRPCSFLGKQEDAGLLRLRAEEGRSVLKRPEERKEERALAHLRPAAPKGESTERDVPSD
jgi:hypothetical protein